MKQSLSVLLAIILLQAFQSVYAADSRETKIQWQTNYEKAVDLSKSSSKPIVLFFTGSDWCGWCSKLEEEVFNTSEFAEDAGNKFVFLKLDYPMYKHLDPQQVAQNKELQKKYDVRNFPTIILLDSKQQLIGTSGYRPGGGKQYASYLLKLVSDYSSYRQKMQGLDKQNLSGNDLKQLFEKANELSLDNDAIRIVKVGMQSDQKKYFLIERYRFLATEGRVHDIEATALRQQLLKLDPQNKDSIPYQLAVIDFEAFYEDMDKESYSPDHAVAPLVDYIEKFGVYDKNNLWRLQMIISQVFLDKNNIDRALKYAQSSYESAPSSVQPEIATAIKNIQSRSITE